MQLKEHQKKGTSSFHGKMVMMFWQDNHLGALLISFWNMNFNTLEQKNCFHEHSNKRWWLITHFSLLQLKKHSYDTDLAMARL